MPSIVIENVESRDAGRGGKELIITAKTAASVKSFKKSEMDDFEEAFSEAMTAKRARSSDKKKMTIDGSYVKESSGGSSSASDKLAKLKEEQAEAAADRARAEKELKKAADRHIKATAAAAYAAGECASTKKVAPKPAPKKIAPQKDDDERSNYTSIDISIKHGRR